MAETLNSPLPKYSIPQMCFLPHQDDDTYEFELDKQFTLAQGGRKSIAIRKIHIDASDYTNFLDNNITVDLVFDIKILYRENEGSELITKQYAFRAIIQTNIVNLKDSIKNYFIKGEFQNLVQNQIDADMNITIVQTMGDTIAITFNFPSKASFSVDYMKIIATYSEDISEYIKDPNINCKKVFIKSFILDLNPLEYHKVDQIFVASSLNPWSPKNIIGNLDENFSILNRIFPYDNQQTFKVWFVTDTGERFPNYNWITGYIELELIIDNQNNFSIDDD